MTARPSSIGVSAPQRGWRRRALLLLPLAALAVAIAAVGIRRVGHWLVVADPLTHARAIVVLSGDFPFRTVEAASIYRQGWAPEVWLTRSVVPEKEAALARLGFQVVREETYSRQLLERLGVSPTAIQVLSEGVQNTAEELRLIARELKRAGGDRVILVTSKAHSRRVRATWRAVVRRSPEAVVRYATEDPFDPSRWWQNTHDARAVSREVLALVNVWAGFPVRPDRARDAVEKPGELR